MRHDPPTTLPAPPQIALTPLQDRVVTAVDLAVVIVTAVLIVLATTGTAGGLRLPLALAFVTFVPGWAVLDHVTLVAGGNARLAVAVGLSLTICTLASLGLLWLHLWYPVPLLDALGLASLLAVLMHLRERAPGAGRDADKRDEVAR